MYNNIPGFGFMRIMLSVAMMLNMSFLIGLTQKESAARMIHQIKKIQTAKAEISHYQALIDEANGEIARDMENYNREMGVN